MHLDTQYQQRVLAKWKDVIDEGDKIKDPQVAIATAMCLENTETEARKTKMLRESYNYGGQNFGGMGTGIAASPQGGTLGTTTDFGANDARLPGVIIPMLRRIFPLLAVHELVGVQPMSTPVGFAFAMRHQYGVNRSGVAGSTVNQGNELGFDKVDAAFTGVSATSAVLPGMSNTSVWNKFASGRNIAGVASAGQEWMKVGEDMPMVQMKIEKQVIEAKSRKLAAHWSPELAEDMAAMHGIDVNSEMASVLSYEIMAEIEQQVLAQIASAALAGSQGSTWSSWSPVSADARHQAERIKSLYTQALIASQKIARNTMRNQANWAIADATTVALLESLGDTVMSKVYDDAKPGIAQVGTLRQGSMKLFRDSLFGSNGSGYLLLGYKGSQNIDSGVIYCPYVPLQLMKEVSESDFTPRIGVRTRYGITDNLLTGSSAYYHYIDINGLTNAPLAADGGRVFTF